MNNKKLSGWALGGILFVCFNILSLVVVYITDWWWFSQVGYTDVFVTSLLTKLALGIGVFVAAFLFLSTNALIAISSKKPWTVVLPETITGRVTVVNNTIAKKIAIIVSLIVSLILGISASSQWQEVLKFFSAVSFNVVDPIFNKDIAYYVFSLPVFNFLLGTIKAIIFLSLVGVLLLYVLRGSLNVSKLARKLEGMQPRHDGSSSGIFENTATQDSSSYYKETPDKSTLVSQAADARLHVGILFALFLIMMAVSTYFSLFELLIGKRGQIFGAMSTDVNIMIPLLWGSIVMIIAGAVAALYWGKTGKLGFLFLVGSLYVFIGFVSAIAPIAYQKLIVAPNELVKETPFIINNITATRAAYGLDDVEEQEVKGDKPLSPKDIANNNLTIKNIRLWDRAPLLSTFSQLQEIRTYYEFTSIDNDRYTIGGEVRQIMLSPRELSTESLPNRNWINERLTFTHGYGVAAGPVNQVTAEGLPVLFVKDLPPKSEVKELTVTRPEIYFGELSSNYVIVNTKSKEFDYPKGEENVYSEYAGDAGVELSFVKRLTYALHFRSLEILLSNDITEVSKILYYRNINERAKKIAPFLTFDRDPYSVIANGKIYWILDGYTTSDRYPYSQPSTLGDSRINYIRSSAKVVIDAYNGSTTVYMTNTDDPIIRTYAKIFPNLFTPLTELPKELAAHLRYPEDIFTLQASIYTTYHMDEPQIFYNKEDQWEVPQIAVEGEQNAVGKVSSAMTPRHMIMKLPREKKEEYILMLPFTPRAKDNLSAWMVARNDGEHYGKLVVYRFPKQSLIYGPKQVIGRINQDAEISRQISLWDQRGSQVIQGSLLVIPIEESLIYVRPLYLKAETGKIPELKRVIVAYENRVAMEETLEASLAQIFGASSLLPRTQNTSVGQNINPLSSNVRDIANQANQAYEAALRAQREGDWTRYGEEIKRLGNLIKEIR